MHTAPTNTVPTSCKERVALVAQVTWTIFVASLLYSSSLVQLQIEEMACSCLPACKIVCLFQGLQLCRCCEKLSRQFHRCTSRCAIHVKQMATADSSAIEFLINPARRWFYGILGTSWSGLNSGGLLGLVDNRFSHLKVRCSWMLVEINLGIL